MIENPLDVAARLDRVKESYAAKVRDFAVETSVVSAVHRWATGQIPLVVVGEAMLGYSGAQSDVLRLLERARSEASAEINPPAVPAETGQDEG